jgi:hypothetical protein
MRCRCAVVSTPVLYSRVPSSIPGPQVSYPDRGLSLFLCVPLDTFWDSAQIGQYRSHQSPSYVIIHNHLPILYYVVAVEEKLSVKVKDSNDTSPAVISLFFTSPESRDKRCILATQHTKMAGYDKAIP